MAQGLSVLGIRAWGGQHRTVSHEERILKIQLGYFENHSNSIKKTGTPIDQDSNLH